MHIALKRAYLPPDPTDGQRLLIDRLWPRGISKDKLHLSAWLKDVAPSDALRHQFHHDPTLWDQFRRAYFAELDAKPDAVRELRDLIAQGPVTLIYAAKDEDHNNALALRDYLSQ